MKRALSAVYTGLTALGMAAAMPADAQESLAPMGWNPVVRTASENHAAPLVKKTALSLPFFEDFTGNSVLPDPSRWTDAKVYINNTMCVEPVSRGVATFDGLDADGLPYNKINPNAALYADSLTSQPIDMSGVTPGDSVYLSFFYQPQGNGFAPEQGDSLMLFLLTGNGDWKRAWAVEGSTLQPFRQVMLPLTDTAYFHGDFRFRFVNIASLNLNDDVWNLDYIRLDKYRGAGDSLLLDMATTLPPASILNNYTAMPYRQFLADPDRELAAEHSFSVRNNYQAEEACNYYYESREPVSGMLLGSGSGNAAIPEGGTGVFPFPVYGDRPQMTEPHARVVFENRYYFDPVTSFAPRENDTITARQVFDNYLAYDDGTAEKSYFLNMYQGMPGKVAVEFHLNAPDTLQGISVYFGRQVPLAYHKYFSAVVYKTLPVHGAQSEEVIFQQDFMDPGYADSVNQFWHYRLRQPVPLPAGVFYLGLTQPALGVSDSLYYGMDANRTGGNYLYFNVLGVWEPSSFSGALMLRPLLGKPVTGSYIGSNDMPVKQLDIKLFPNPSKTEIYLEDAGGAPLTGAYRIADQTGRIAGTGSLYGAAPVDIAMLAPGIYFISIRSEGGVINKKFTKI